MVSHLQSSAALRFCLTVVMCGLFCISIVRSQSMFKMPVLNPQQKVALVVGNNNYQALNKLRNTNNDAKLIGDTLSSLGFKVIYRYNLTKSGMEDAFRELSETLQPNSVAFFYYSGHGVQIGGVNYLVPVDASIQKGPQGLWDIGAAMNNLGGKSRMNIIVLDSCRTSNGDIYKMFHGDPGFTQFQKTPDGTYVAFATSPGETASDGTGNNSPYAAMLSDSLRLRPAEIDQVFMFTQLQVEQATNGKQVPWRNSSTKAMFYFTPDATAAAPTLYSAIQGQLQNQLLGGLLGGIQPFKFNVPSLNERGTILEQKPGTAKRFIERLGFVPLEMVQIGGGKFLMGATDRESTDALNLAKQFEEFDEETWQVLQAELPQHAVNIKGFDMSRTEITQAQYYAVMGSLPPIDSRFRGENLPVINVTWTEANEFCARLSKATGRFYRLPTEAQWEYAARGGSDMPFPFGETINQQVAAYNWALPYGKAPRGTRPLGPKEVGVLSSTNAFGLEDMQGNVWEWTADYWHSDYDGAPVDGSSWDEPQAITSDDADEQNATDTSRVVRGGSWVSPASRCRSASRYRYSPITRSSSVGFRIIVQ